MKDIILSVKEAKALDAEMAALTDANSQLIAQLASAKTAGEKVAGLDKIAEALAGVMVSKKLISADKVAETKVALAKDGGVAAYFKKACDLYSTAEAARKEAEATLAEIPSRIGRTSKVEKKAGETRTELPVSNLKAAEDRFAQRVLAAR